MTVARDTLFQDPFFTSSASFDDFRKEMLRESKDIITHIKQQFEMFSIEDMEEGNKTIIEKTEIREGPKLEKETKRETRAITGPTVSDSKRKKLTVLPLTYESGNEIAKMSPKEDPKVMEDNQVIKVCQTILRIYFGIS